MKSNIVLFGGGNHLQYSLDIIEREGKYNVVGIIDSVQPIGAILFGYKVIGRQENLSVLITEYGFDAGLITVGDNWIRMAIHDAIIEQLPNFRFVNALHPSVIIGNNVQMGTGIIAMAGCIFNPGAKVGDFTFFATGAQIEHDCEIGDYASISAGTILGGHVKIGKFSAVTLNVTVVDRLTIGENTVVGAGSLVTKSLPDNVLAYGMPAKIIRSREARERFLK
ncbi:NeuD/PglB/VioB family sugar acetyltransferase [Flavipsychrobacter stenotrophus]|nr:NeuD/PglB/VioB family sugar acetyltransferase [Flavipsychrobacter stenotrophus]